MTKEKAALKSQKFVIEKEIWLVYQEDSRIQEYFPTKEEAYNFVVVEREMCPASELEETVSGGWACYDYGITIMPELLKVEGTL